MDIERNPAAPIIDAVINPRCRVWNDNDKEYVEFYNDEEIRIPAHGFIEMDLSTAAMFMGQSAPMFKTLPNKKKIANPKMLRREVIDSEKEISKKTKAANEQAKFSCMVCGENFKNNTGLSAHVRMKHADKEAASTPEKFKEIMDKEKTQNDSGGNRNIL